MMIRKPTGTCRDDMLCVLPQGHGGFHRYAGGDRAHVAPCSCELHVRIRELEQTLEEGLDYLRVREQELAIVTEKVRELEAELDKLRPKDLDAAKAAAEGKSRRDPWNCHHEWDEMGLCEKCGNDSAEYVLVLEYEARRLEARVAELEAEAWDAHMEHGPGRHCRRCVEPALAIEGQGED